MNIVIRRGVSLCSSVFLIIARLQPIFRKATFYLTIRSAFIRELHSSLFSMYASTFFYDAELNGLQLMRFSILYWSEL